MKVYIPDANPIDVPDRGQTVEEIRLALIDAGFAQLESASGTKDANGDVRFARPQGGTKGR